MSYNLLAPVHLISAQSMAGDVTSSPIEIKLQDNVGIQLNWTGAPVGSFAVQISADHQQDSLGNVTVVGNWIALALSPGISASGSAGSAYIDLNQMTAPYIRVVYTSVSGTGTLDAYIVGKGV